jgi:hypothetical protein
LVTEHEQEHQNDNDEKDDRENAAAASAASGFYDGRMFALGIAAVVIGHGNSPCLAGCLPVWRSERIADVAVPGMGAGMRRTATAIFAALVGLGACSQGTNNQAQANLEEANQAAENAAEVPESKGSNAVSNASLAEPKGPIDPKSAEAAGQVVQHYGALIERSRWLQAERQWGDVNLARDFATDLGTRFREVHLEIGDLGDIEGAAGSMYTAVPVVFYGQSRKGESLRLPASITLRRVNDVPGSTDRERQWHIERIEWKGRA